MDGHGEPFELLRQDHGRTASPRSATPDSTVPAGRARLRDQVPRSTGCSQPGSGDGAETQFYWNLIPAGWEQAITQSDLTVHLPADARTSSARSATTPAAAGQGRGHQRPARHRDDLAPSTPVTLKTGLDMETPAAGNTLPWPARWTGSSAKLLGLAAGPAAVGRRRRVGGQPAGAHGRREEPAVPAAVRTAGGHRAGPGGVHPHEEVDNSSYIATMMYAAEKGASTSTEATRLDDHRQEGAAGLDRARPGHHRRRAPARRPRARPSSPAERVEAGKRLKTELTRSTPTPRAGPKDHGLMVNSGLGGLGRLLVIGPASVLCWARLLQPVLT